MTVYHVYRETTEMVWPEPTYGTPQPTKPVPRPCIEWLTSDQGWSRSIYQAAQYVERHAELLATTHGASVIEAW
jgi:hypothetical protein